MATTNKQGAPGRKKKSARKRRKIKVIVFIIEILILLVVLAALYISLKMEKIDSGLKIDKEELDFNIKLPEVEETLDQYTTIALFGLDNRSNGNFQSGNSDVIMVASINNKTKEVKLASVYRDTYLNITEDDGYRKANAAYNRGGPRQAINMLNTNLDLNITDYVAVDFNAVARAVDTLGGVEIELTNQEASLINGYIDEVAELTGKEANHLWSGGTYNLDGVQATAYARIRYTAGSDFKRTERQRLVIQKMVEKALASDLGTINNLIDEVFPYISTSFTSLELLDLAKDAFSYSLGENTGFPFELEAKDIKNAGDCVVAVDLASNVDQLHAFLYENEEYEVSKTVQEISDHIVEVTGLARDEDSDNAAE